MKPVLLIAAMCIGFASCQEDTLTTNELPASKQLDFGDFTIEVPAQWQPITLQGIDSYVGGIAMDQSQQATFDLGRYSNSLDVEFSTHVVEIITIDGKSAKVVSPMTPGRGTTGVFIANVNDGGLIRFEMHGDDLTAENQEALRAAVETIDFK